MRKMDSTIDLYDLIFNALRTMLESGAMEIRDVDDKGEQPFLYASGWSGLGYILVKALVSHQFFAGLVMLLATKVASVAPKTTFVAGNLTGGAIPGWLLSRYLETLLGHPVKFMLMAGARKEAEAMKKSVMLVDKKILETAAQQIASAVFDYIHEEIHFVAGGAPGGMILGHRISEILSLYYGRHVPFVYVRDKKKTGGHGEMITGIQNNPFFKEGMTALAIGCYPGDHRGDRTRHVSTVLEESGFKAATYHDATDDNQLSPFPSAFFDGLYEELSPWGQALDEQQPEGIVAEELTNFTVSTRNSANVLERKYRLHVPFSACLLSYDQPEATKALNMEGLSLISLFTLQDLLTTARKIGSHPGKLIKGYKRFLADPVGWNVMRGIEKVERGGTL
jgi:orotate phosphoribosyltransferase